MRRPGSGRNGTGRYDDATRNTATAEGPRRRLPSLVVASVVAAAMIAGGSAYFAANGAPGDHRDHPPLTLDRLAERTQGPSGPAIAPGEPNPYGVVYFAKGELPEGPGSAHVYRTGGSVGATEVARLAKALGIGGTPQSDGAVWKVGATKDGAGPLLRVEQQSPGAWTFTRFAPSPGGDNCLKGRSCPDGGISEGSAVSERTAERAAAPVLRSLGLDDAELDAGQLLGAVRVVNADPLIGGLPTYGWSTGIQVGSDGQVVSGSGQLKNPDRSDEYPVIGADAALEALNKAAYARVRIGGCATAVPPADGEKPAAPCKPKAAAQPVMINTVIFGLAAHSVDGRRALVPSWLFEVVPGGAASPYTVTQPAVAQQYLKTPTTSVRIESYSTSGRTLSLHFWGGLCSDYAARADEGRTAVKVEVTASRPDPEQVCAALIKTQTVTVTLDEPLGERPVVDGTTGERVHPS